jgi:hypothetical protein
MAEFDSDTILNNAFREAWGLSKKAEEYRSSASQMERTRQAIPVATFLGAVGAAGSGAANYLSVTGAGRA